MDQVDDYMMQQHQAAIAESKKPKNYIEAYDDKIVQSAVATEPIDYGPILKRLQDVRVVRLLHVALGLCTETGEFVDMLKKHIFYGKPIDRVNLLEELGDLSWYERIGANVLDSRFLTNIETNIAKLRLRYPEKFTELDAMVRNLQAERELLESHADNTTNTSSD